MIYFNLFSNQFIDDRYNSLLIKPRLKDVVFINSEAGIKQTPY